MAKESNKSTPSTPSLTPLMEQYNTIKSRYPEYIVFFRLGDFYEMFGEDAIESAPIMGVVLTQRQGVPMCGVPHHSANNYIKNLLAAGKKVAICEQQEVASPSKKLIEREVVRIITPGTIWEENLIDSHRNNFLVSVYFPQGMSRENEKSVGIAVADISTTEIYLKQILKEALRSEITKLKPKEVVIQESLKTEKIPELTDTNSSLFSYVPDWHFDEKVALEEITKISGAKSWKSFGVDGKLLSQRALGGLISYLKQTQHPDIQSLLADIKYKGEENILFIDSTAIRNLEITSSIVSGGRQNSLIDILDICKTPMGSRLLLSWILEPSTDVNKITKRHDAVEYFYTNNHLRNAIRDVLKKIGDVERILTRLTTKSATPREMWHIGSSIKLALEVKKLITSEISIVLPSLIEETLLHINEINNLVEIIDKSISPDGVYILDSGVSGSGFIKGGFNTLLDEYRRLAHDTKSVIIELERKERERTKINSLKIGYTSVFGYYIEVTKPNLALVPPDYIRKQTLTSAERFVIPELIEIEKKISYASQKIESLEKEILANIREKILSERSKITSIAKAIAVIDVLTTFAEISVKNNWSRPSVNTSDIIDIKNSRHPVVEQKLKAGEFVPNDIYLDSEENQIIILTGPNMSGKSTYLRQIALCLILAQSGCFIPAESASIGVVDRIFTRIGSADNLAGGESTFMVEMIETANILRNVTPRSFIILDEIGRGTSTFDGISIAWAIIEYLHNIKLTPKPKVLFATHYFELTELANIPATSDTETKSILRRGIKNYNVSVKEWKNEVVFLHKIVPGAADRSYGIYVAKLAGIPQEVIERSKTILYKLQSHSHSLSKKETPWVQTDFEDILLFDKLKSIEINKITPLEALNLLSELTNTAKSQK